MQNVGTPQEVAAYERRTAALEARSLTAHVLAHHIERLYRSDPSRAVNLDDPHTAALIVEYQQASDTARAAVDDWREIVGITE